MTESKGMSTRHRDVENFSQSFLVYINSTKNGNVVCRAPEDLTLQLSSDWDSPLAQGSGTGILEVTAQNLAGLSTRTQFASAQIWSGTSPIEITLPLEFQAEEDPRREVIEPIIRLSRMALPFSTRGDRGLFEPPGPRIFGQSGNPDNIIIQLGDFLLFRNIIVTNVNPIFNTRDMGIDGVPIRAKCDVTFRTVFSLTGEDFESMFLK